MGIRECGWEDRVQRAARGGFWNPGLRAHVAQCAVCADVALVAGAMRAEAVASQGDVAVPGPGRVWWRASLLARQEAVARATRPIAVWETCASVVGLGAVMAVVWRFWPAVTASAMQVQQAWVLGPTTGLGVLFTSVALAAAALLAFLIWFGFYFVRADV